VDLEIEHKFKNQNYLNVKVLYNSRKMAKQDNTIWWVIGVIVVLVILVGGGFGIFGGKDKPNGDINAQEYSLFLEQEYVDIGGENEKSLGVYTFSCLELRSHPCLNSGGQFTTTTGACSINVGSVYDNCDKLSKKICESQFGVYNVVGKHCDLLFYDKLLQDIMERGDEIYEYPLVNVGGTIQKRV